MWYYGGRIRIEPDWNVKAALKAAKAAVIVDQNRTRLECKESFNFGNFSSVMNQNRTRLECKDKIVKR